MRAAFSGSGTNPLLVRPEDTDILTRTRRFVAHFSAPFTLKGIEGLHPAGAYALDQEEELVSDTSRLAYRRVGMFMHLPAISTDRCALEMVPVEASEIENALLEDLEKAH